jgi:hypothetical protein
MHRLCQHFVTRTLTSNKKKHERGISGDLIDRADKGNKFLNNIITGDETRCFLYDPQTQRQSSEWKSSPPPLRKKFSACRSKEKFMLEVFFFGCQSTVHYQTIPEGKTVNKGMHIDIFRCLMDAARKKRPEKREPTVSLSFTVLQHTGRCWTRIY